MALLDGYAPRSARLARGAEQALRGILIAALVAATAGVAAAAEGDGERDETTTVVTEGFSPGGGLAARSRALEAAERDAVVIYLTDLLNQQALGAVRPIINRYDTFVQSSRILQEETVEGGIRLEAEVYLRGESLEMEAARRVLPSLPMQPMAIILAAEEIPNERYFSVGSPGVIEQQLAQAFVDTGFLVVAPKLLRQRYTQEGLLQRLNSGPEALARFGRENEAHLVVAVEGRVDTEPVSRAVGRAKATITVRVVDARNRAVTDTVKAEAAVHGAAAPSAARAALADAALKVQDRVLVAAVLAMAAVEPSNAISLTVLDPPDRSSMQQLRKEIGGLSGVANAELLRISDGEALFTFDYQGKVGGLVDGLEGLTAGERRLEAKQVVGAEMVFELRDE